jgi:hypothetical protein
MTVPSTPPVHVTIKSEPREMVYVELFCKGGDVTVMGVGTVTSKVKGGTSADPVTTTLAGRGLGQNGMP